MGGDDGPSLIMVCIIDAKVPHLSHFVVPLHGLGLLHSLAKDSAMY